MRRKLKKIPYISLCALFSGFFITGCAPSRSYLIPLEQVQQLETRKTSKRDIFDKFGPPRAIAARDEVAIFPAERIAGWGRMTPSIYDSSRPIHEGKTQVPYYKIDSDTLFELFSQDHELSEYHQIYYYSDSILRRGVYEPESRMWLLVNERTGLVEDYVYRKHYNAVIGKEFRDVRLGLATEFEEKRPQRRRASNYWYIGGGGLTGELSTNNTAFDSVEGSGEHFVGGLTFGRFSLEVNTGGFDFRTKGPTQEVFYPQDDASYSFFGVGLKFDILDLDKMGWSPWLALESAQHDYGLSNYVYSISGSCSTLVAGLDVRIANWLLLRGGRRECSYSAKSVYSDFSNSMDVTLYTLDTVFRFRTW